MRCSRQLSALNTTDSNTTQVSVVIGLLSVIAVMHSLYCYYFIDLYI